MNILITNDDGINAIGIRILAKELSNIGKVTIVAPDRERSASGHSITLHSPLRIVKTDIDDRVEAYMVSGTPNDCIKIALESILDKKPDLIVSGINNGANLGTDILYSGTVSAAIEGGMHNIRSIAISASYDENKINYEGAKYYSCKLINFIMNLKDGLIFNVNIPSINKEDIKGILMTELGIRKYKNKYLKREDPMGKNYYWLDGELMDIKNKINSDIKAIENKYISITPLYFDLTDYKSLEKLKKENI
ncbi:5'/3'-nucleotidase SurE [Clostridium sp. D2Q-14]|uniref:5'/3'-nucleotidase SurE n=1 Tax=Anaeromonas gelatinilytica TaxID=2683194 RepID=UPI00193C0DE5|nr:5'/3'-nucleotidase SurE [Anaeromonas gelatinilytica]MBS4536246.1 5'/3'-nucleotidase SurE [Anaeromonas gelatinilytica]